MKLTNRGFTLVELMIVIAIIGILAAALFPSMTAYLKRSRDAARTAGIKDITTAVGAFYADKERYPDTDSGVLVGCVYPVDISTNYLPKGIPADPQAANRNGCGDNSAAANAKYAYGSYGSGSTSGSSNVFIIGSILENANGGNTGTTYFTTGATGLFGINRAFGSTMSAGLVKGSGQGYALSN